MNNWVKPTYSDWHKNTFKRSLYYKFVICWLMIEERIWMLLARKLTGVATLRETYELEKFMFENPEDQSTIRIITALWRNRDEVTMDPGAERKFIELLKKTYEEEARHFLSRVKKKNKFF